MFDRQKIKVAAIFAAVLSVLIVIFASYSLGQQSNKPKQTQQNVQQVKQLNTTDVKNFLIAYYTKKDLGENDSRIKPLMTEQMYTQETNKENLPIAQAYKGLVIDQVFDSASIYINTDENTALVQVNYHDKQLQSRDQDPTKVTDTSEKQSIKLTFQQKDGTQLVDNMQVVVINQDGGDTSNSYSSSGN